MAYNITFPIPSNYDVVDASGGYAYKCFPVRKFRNTDDDGAWVIEYNEQKLKQWKKARFKDKNPIKERDPFIKFTKAFLKEVYFFKDAKDLCCINISGKNLKVMKNEDFKSFNNVAVIEANDNQLKLEAFQTFPNLEELELQLNNILNIHITSKDFLCLTRLDLSYNNLEENGLLSIGKMRNLKSLTMRGCGLNRLPPGLSRSYQISDEDDDLQKCTSLRKTRFPSLVSFDLSENHLSDISTFSSLAGLKKLKTLNLSSNQITGIPHLRLLLSDGRFSLSTITQQDYSSSLKSVEKSPTNENVLPDINKAMETTYEPQKVQSFPQGNILEIDDFKRSKSLNDITKMKDQNKCIDLDLELLNNIDASVKSLASDDHQSETKELLDMNFGKEMNFTLLDDIEIDSENNQEHASDNITILNEEVAVTNVDHNDASDNFVMDTIENPFQSLEVLDLSNNRISKEESLLSLTVWPKMRELILWGNPIINSQKGVPTILDNLLHKMCGINLVRKERRAHSKRQMKLQKTRRIKTDLPPIKRNNLLMIEAAIQKAVKEKEESKNNSFENTSKSETYEEEVEDIDEASNLNQPNVFLTQIDQDDDENNDLPKETDFFAENADRDIPQSYVEVLKIDESIADDKFTSQLPNTIQGSLNVLKELLDHRLVVHKGLPEAGMVKKVNKEKLRKFNSSGNARVSKEVNILESALKEIKLQETKYQENLEYVLDEYSSNKEIRKNFPEMKMILQRVQKKYNDVRMESLGPILQMQKEVTRLSTRVDKPPNELILSRMKQNRIGDIHATRSSGVRWGNNISK